MEIKLICDCEECHSCLLELGCVNILIDIPVKLLRDFSETLKQPLICDFDTNCVLYEKLNCSDIHVILLTNSRGFEGLDLLSYFYDLNNTHIVCTRSVYVLATIYYQNYSYELNQIYNKFDGNLKEGLTNKDDKFKGFHCNKLLNNLKEVKYDEGFSLSDFLNNNLLHLISYNELLKIDVTTSETRQFNVQKENEKKHTSDTDNTNKEQDEMENTSKNERNWTSYLNDFNAELELVAMSNGHSLGSCNYLIRYGNLSEKVVLVSKSSDRNRYAKPFNYSIFDNLNKDDVIVLLSNPNNKNTNNNNRDNTNNNNGNNNKEPKEKTELKLEKEENKEKLKVKEEKVEMDTDKEEKEKETNKEQDEDKMDVDEYYNGELFDSVNEKNKNKEKKEDNNEEGVNYNDAVDCLSLYCIDKIEKGNNVIIPVDFNYEYLVDLLESFNRSMKNNKKQMFVYCVGKGVEDLFDYLEKCCEWVREERSEYSMHSEDPRSPFPKIDEMKINNKLFISDNVNGIANVYRVPSVLILVVFKEEEMVNYLNNTNNRFLILQNKFLKYLNKNKENNTNNNNKENNNNQENNTNNNNKENNNNNNTNNNNNRDNNNNSCNYNYYKVDLEMDLNRINTNARVVDLRKSYLSGNESVKVELDEDSVGFVRGQMNKELFYNLRFMDLGDDLKVNLFKVDLENMDEVVIKEKYTKEQKDKKDKYDNKDNNTNNENKNNNNNNKEEDDDIDELMMFGNYDYNKLNEELKKHFNNASVEIIKQPENGLVILSSSNLFNIVIDNENKTTVIETISEKYRKNILKSIQKLMLTL